MEYLLAGKKSDRENLKGGSEPGTYLERCDESAVSAEFSG